MYFIIVGFLRVIFNIEIFIFNSFLLHTRKKPILYCVIWKPVSWVSLLYTDRCAWLYVYVGAIFLATPAPLYFRD